MLYDDTHSFVFVDYDVLEPTDPNDGSGFEDVGAHLEEERFLADVLNAQTTTQTTAPMEKPAANCTVASALSA